MPHIRLRGVSADQIVQLNTPLIKEVSKIINSPEDHFTFEHVQTFFYAQGKMIKENPFIEVLWFSRGLEIQDACAKVITDKFKSIVADQDVTVVFIEISKNGYYENGKHF